MTETPLTATKPATGATSDKPAHSGRRSGGLIRSSMVYSAFTLISRVMGFFRDLAVSYTMGASSTFAADAFNTAFQFPNLFRRIFAEGAFASAFVPAYSRSLERDGDKIADELAADAMAVLAVATLAITVVAELTMPWLMYLLRPGFAAHPEKFKLAVLLTQITMPYLPCMAIYAHLSGVLNARNRFILSAAAPILLNVWTLVTVLPARTPVEAATWASAGVVLAGISQAMLLAWGCKRSGAHVGFRWPRLTPEIKQLIMLAVPGAISASATQINVFVSGILVSHVNGAASWLAYCDRLYQLPQGLVGVAVGVALLPQLSRAVHAGDHGGARASMDQAITFSMALTAPAAAALIAIPFFLVDALYVRGAFTLDDAHQTSAALFYYGLGVPAFVLVQLFAKPFYARQDTKTPMRFGLLQVGVNVAVGVSLFHVIGVPGIAAGTATAWWLNVILLAATLAKRGDYTPSPRAVSKLLRITLASVALGAVLGAISHFRPPIEAVLSHAAFGPLHGKELALLLTFAFAVGLYPALLFASGGLTLSEAKAAMRKRRG